ncbi:hypothetical protein BDZ94DRAFT_238186 [Collybia nuda]|uniref:Secreted protein n=1 Tax=Collybia nuda TaxID=64659 RepID=A0A9P5XUN2_9AGAR|nr:hypothetical protein BDZ94DRAFT_238186 [Collybia nuda]
MIHLLSMRLFYLVAWLATRVSTSPGPIRPVPVLPNNRSSPFRRPSTLLNLSAPVIYNPVLSSQALTLSGRDRNTTRRKGKSIPIYMHIPRTVGSTKYQDPISISISI